MMVKYIRTQLTDSSTLHFLCHNPKDRQHLNHNLSDRVDHGRSWCDTYIYLGPAEETFNAVKDVDKFVLPSIRIFNRLGSVSK